MKTLPSARRLCILLLAACLCAGCDEDEDRLNELLAELGQMDSAEIDDSIVPDTDRDGLSDQLEALLGTSPTDADSDDDALLDGWEVRGVNGIDLRGKGADPLRKDIFVQMDFMVDGTRDCRPSDRDLTLVVEAFDQAPVDGGKGIAVHLEYGNRVRFSENLRPAKKQFEDIVVLGKHFSPERRPVYHYMIWAWQYQDFLGKDSSGFSMADAAQATNLGIFAPGQAFCVTVRTIRDRFSGTSLAKAEAGTFMHELGHNLGLPHGGTDIRTYKPNHLSVMNYSFQFLGVFRGRSRPLDYQRFRVPGLDESLLIESKGLGLLKDLRPYKTVFYDETTAQPPVHAAGAIDWDQAGGISTKSLEGRDINRDGNVTMLGPTVDEWTLLRFDGGAIGSRKREDKLWPDDPDTLFLLEPNRAVLADVRDLIRHLDAN